MNLEWTLVQFWQEINESANGSANQADLEAALYRFEQRLVYQGYDEDQIEELLEKVAEGYGMNLALAT
jgi:hypothetical protein